MAYSILILLKHTLKQSTLLLMVIILYVDKEHCDVATIGGL
jgi:hypothetical protein